MTDETIPRRLRRFYRDGSAPEETVTENEAVLEEKSRDNNNPRYEQLRSHTKDEAVALALREVKRFMEQKKRLPRESERDEIAENLFNQLQNDLPSGNNTASGQSVAQRAAARRTRLQAEKSENQNPVLPPSKAPANEENAVGGQEGQSGISVSELFTAPTNSTGLDLSGIMMNDPLLGGKNRENLLLEKEDVPNLCPHCQVKTDSIVYCPSCGNGFCPNCAKSAKNEGEKTNYTCPVCGHFFSSRKRASV